MRYADSDAPSGGRRKRRACRGKPQWKLAWANLGRNRRRTALAVAYTHLRSGGRDVDALLHFGGHRPGSGADVHTEVFRLPADAGRPPADPGLFPVSYTHLDVYKRQILYLLS